MNNKKIEHFDPNGPGLNNGNFIGLPFGFEDAELILYPVPWDVTVSYGAGTSQGPDNIRSASTQLDLYHPTFVNAWEKGIYFEAQNKEFERLNAELRPLAKMQIEELESGLSSDEDTRSIINEGCRKMVEAVYQRTRKMLSEGKKVGLVGGDHSTPLGYYKALSEKVGSFAILHIDAHMDLRHAYEGFTFSHASICFNTLQALSPHIGLYQVGLRDFCEEEVRNAAKWKVRTWTARDIDRELFGGRSWDFVCTNIIEDLPEKVYVSLDIDALDPAFCPHTGTPVPGGLSYSQTIYLLDKLHESGRAIVGFDVVETGGHPHEYDANVAARLIYQLCLMMLDS